MEASDCFLYFLPEKLREFEVLFFSLLPFREVLRSAALTMVVVTFFFWLQRGEYSDHQSGQVFLFRGLRLLAIEVIKVSVPLLRS